MPNPEENNRKKRTYALLIFIMVASIIYWIILYNIQSKGSSEDKPLEVVVDIVASSPETDGSFFYGAQDAPITVVVYTSFDCTSCKEFITQTYPLLKGYADDGKIRIYHKDFLYPDDISDKTAIYNRSKMFYCVGLSDSRHYWDYYPLFFTTSSDFLELDQNTYSKEEFIDCISSVPEVLTRSAHEVFLYGLNAEPTLFIGIDGKDNAIISGIPSEDRLRREIRMKEIYIGTE